MKKIIIFMTAVIMSVMMTSCGSETIDNGKLKVYTSFYAMYDFAKTVGCDDIELTNIVPAGGEAHHFEPSAADMAKLSECDVFIYSGNGMEEWAEDIASTLPESVKVVETSKGLSVDESDPHVWLSIENAKSQIDAICSAFSESDSENAENYVKRTDEYKAKLDLLDEEYKNAGLSGKKLFVTHGAYGYLCRDYGMEQVALEGVQGESDPSPSQMAQVVDMIKVDGAKGIFYDPNGSDKTAAAVADEAGVLSLELCTFETDSENRDYLTVMSANLQELKKGLI